MILRLPTGRVTSGTPELSPSRLYESTKTNHVCICAFIDAQRGIGNGHVRRHVQPGSQRSRARSAIRTSSSRQGVRITLLCHVIEGDIDGLCAFAVETHHLYFVEVFGPESRGQDDPPLPRHRGLLLQVARRLARAFLYFEHRRFSASSRVSRSGTPTAGASRRALLLQVEKCAPSRASRSWSSGTSSTSGGHIATRMSARAWGKWAVTVRDGWFSILVSGVLEDVLAEVAALRAEVAALRASRASGLLDAKGAAEFLSMTAEAVATAGRRGRLPSHRLPNGHRRYDPVELLAWAKGEAR